jgi:hypothetical protein
LISVVTWFIPCSNSNRKDNPKQWLVNSKN